MDKFTRQTAFETAVKGLYAQGAIAIENNSSCKFRATNGNRCAVGMLMPDEVYSEQMEDEWLPTIFEDFKEFRNLFVENELPLDKMTSSCYITKESSIAFFLMDLQQSLHDNFHLTHNDIDSISYREWLFEKAHYFAEKHNLKNVVVKI